MRIVLTSLLAVWSSVAFAEDYTKLTAIPCTGAISGEAMIIERAPTAAELAAEPPTVPETVLQMLYDHISCNGTAWIINQTIKRYSAPAGQLSGRMVKK